MQHKLNTHSNDLQKATSELSTTKLFKLLKCQHGIMASVKCKKNLFGSWTIPNPSVRAFSAPTYSPGAGRVRCLSPRTTTHLSMAASKF